MKCQMSWNVKCHEMSNVFHCPSETIPYLRSPKVAPINGIPVETSLQNIYCGSLKHSHVRILDKKLGWGLWRPDIQRPLEGDSREQHFTMWKFTYISHTENVQHIDIFLTGYLNVSTLQLYKALKESCIILRRAHGSKDDGTRGKIPITFVLGKCNSHHHRAFLEKRSLMSIVNRVKIFKRWHILKENFTHK